MTADSALTSTSAEESLARSGMLRGTGRLGETGGSVTGSNAGDSVITLPASAHLSRSPTKLQADLNAAWLDVPLRSIEDHLCMVCAVPPGAVGGSFRRGFEDQLDGSRPEVSRSGVILRVQDEVFCPYNLGFFPQTYTAEPLATLRSHVSHVRTTSWGRADLGGRSRAMRVVDIGGGVGTSRGQSIGNVVEVKLLGSFLVSIPQTGQTIFQTIAIDVCHPLARHLSCLDDVVTRMPAVLSALRDWVLKSYLRLGPQPEFRLQDVPTTSTLLAEAHASWQRDYSHLPHPPNSSKHLHLYSRSPAPFPPFSRTNTAPGEVTAVKSRPSMQRTSSLPSNLHKPRLANAPPDKTSFNQGGGAGITGGILRGTNLPHGARVGETEIGTQRQRSRGDGSRVQEFRESRKLRICVEECAAIYDESDDDYDGDVRKGSGVGEESDDEPSVEVGVIADESIVQILDLCGLDTLPVALVRKYSRHGSLTSRPQTLLHDGKIHLCFSTPQTHTRTERWGDGSPRIMDQSSPKKNCSQPNSTPPRGPCRKAESDSFSVIIRSGAKRDTGSRCESISEPLPEEPSPSIRKGLVSSPSALYFRKEANKIEEESETMDEEVDVKFHDDVDVDVAIDVAIDTYIEIDVVEILSDFGSVSESDEMDHFNRSCVGGGVNGFIPKIRKTLSWGFIESLLINTIK